MAQTPLLETRHAGGFIVSEPMGTHRHIDRETLTGGVKIYPGTVLGAKVTTGTAAAVATSGNTGTGTVGAITVAAPAGPGAYRLVITKAAANAGDFEVIDPQGDVIGVGTVGAAFSSGGLGFTLSDATDFIVGDSFTITVAITTTKYAPLALAGTDGTQNAAGIAYDYSDVVSADAPGAVVKRACEVNKSELLWPSGITSAQLAVGLAQLSALGIIGR